MREFETITFADDIDRSSAQILPLSSNSYVQHGHGEQRRHWQQPVGRSTGDEMQAERRDIVGFEHGGTHRDDVQAAAKTIEKFKMFLIKTGPFSTF